MLKFNRLKPLQQTIVGLSIGLSAAVAIAAGLPTAVTAQTSIDPEEVQQYANSVLQIETLRTVALRDIQPLVDSAILQALACHEQDTVRRLPNEAEDIFVNYCTQSIGVVEQSGLTVSRFNEITRAYNSDNLSLKAQIQQALQQIQSEAVSRSTQPPQTQPASQTVPNTTN